jgi:carboxyl-terminal processing protease
MTLLRNTPQRAYWFVALAVFACVAALQTDARAQTTLIRETVPTSLTPSSNVNTNAAKSSAATLVEQSIFQGSQLEANQQWGEALVHYEQAVKDYPQDENLNARLLNAKVHYDLQRRYLDPSYVRAVLRGDQRTSLETYAEVLLKIQSHYVDDPDWLAFARRGFNNLDVALFDTAFQQQHLQTVSYEELHRAQQVLHQQLGGKTIVSRQDLYQFAVQASQILRREINLTEPAAIHEFISGTVGALDPYSAYLTASQFNETMNHIEGNFVGLGVEIRPTQSVLEIVDVIKGGPASEGGIRRGDQIVSIDGKRVTDLGGDVAADLLRGLEGSTVALEIARADVSPFQLTLLRRRVDIPSVEEARIVDQQYGIGYIKLVNFQKTTLQDFDNALWKLHREGMQSLIVDLRGNPGGLLNAAVDLADRFIASGVIVSTRGRNPQEDYVHRAHAQGTWGVPLTVLIDGNSASASEILAGAVHDHRRGTVVGQQSYGKGSVQGIFPLSLSGGGMRLTTAKFYSPLGTAISHRGITPDVAVTVTRRVSDQTLAEGGEQRDDTMNAGIRVAREKVAVRK